MYVCHVYSPRVGVLVSWYADGCMYLSLYAYMYVMYMYIL